MQKKLFCFLSAILLVLNSCSNDNDTIAENTILPKTLKTIFPNSPSENFVTDIVYDGNKIVSISNKRVKIEYIYSDNQIIKEITYNIGNVQEKSEKVYTYINDSLKTVTTVVYEQETRYVYIYNADGTVNIETYILDKGTAKESKKPESQMLTFVNGNLVKSVFNSASREMTTTSNYDYDTNNSAFKNITGLNLLLDQFNLGDEISLSSTNNVKKYNEYSIFGLGTVAEPYANTMEYEYNKKRYPIKKTTYDYTGKTTKIVEYTY